MRLDRKWTSHLKTNKDKEEFRKLIIAASRVFDRLQEILEKDLESAQKKGDSEESFEMAAWAEYQAHIAGQRKALRNIIGLLPTIDHAKEN